MKLRKPWGFVCISLVIWDHLTRTGIIQANAQGTFNSLFYHKKTQQQHCCWTWVTTNTLRWHWEDYGYSKAIAWNYTQILLECSILLNSKKTDSITQHDIKHSRLQNTYFLVKPLQTNKQEVPMITVTLIIFPPRFRCIWNLLMLDGIIFIARE